VTEKDQRPVVLVVDDEAYVADRLADDLRSRFGGDYRVETAVSADQALALVGRCSTAGEELAIVLADAALPDVPGLDLLASVHTVYPHAKRVLLVERNYRATSPSVRAMALGQIDYHLSKPWHTEATLYPAISEILADWISARHASFEWFSVIGGSDTRSSQLREALRRLGLPFRSVDIASPAGRELLAGTGCDGSRLPVVVRYDGKVLIDPTKAEIMEAFGTNTHVDVDRCDLAVVGAGPAGLSAAIYAASEGLETVVLESETSGGQAGSSALIRNYPGFPHGIGGGMLMHRACEQAWLFGANMVFATDARGLTVRGPDKVLALEGGREVTARTVVVATGMRWRRLGVERLEALVGAGVFYGAAATEAHGMEGEHVYVVGGANSAGQAAVHLARYAERVTMLVRAGSLGVAMSAYLVQQIASSGNIDVRLGTRIVDAGGDERLKELVLDTGDGRETVPATAVFVMIGGSPNTEWLAGAVALDEHGFVLTGRDLAQHGIEPPGGRPPLLLESSVPGVFAAGDVRHGSIKRVASAVGEGSIAVTASHEYLDATAEESPVASAAL
jgi:thioredoxin reductase (NADPH)